MFQQENNCKMFIFLKTIAIFKSYRDCGTFAMYEQAVNRDLKDLATISRSISELTQNRG